MTNKKLLSALIMMALTTSVLGSVYAADESNGDAVKDINHTLLPKKLKNYRILS